MTTTPKILVEFQDLLVTANDFYTSPTSGKGTYIDKITATNHGAVTCTVNVWLVASGSSALDINKVISSKSLASEETYTFPEIAGKFIAPGSKITALCSVAACTNFGVSGREIT